ncbi:MAG: 30S ribosomal protein S5, small subunit ribosomal protein S5 [Candidatus Peregrinibacteria bacterium GW2011_GWC2_39_14]|nr:MAG: 30S ribosomal protein S5 [Candidatus Peregrinibacteria bacterium GW2011_GWA2_38_36]KKR06847.1 MAG: 30S ribosomal protein S5, small subunit ribosomal protein S5 [Candidatus Peregrinibacteria bacterium GW2011_GWC2_39_14]
MARNAHRGGPRGQEVKEFEEEVLELSRVTRVVAGGRRMRFRATVVIGNRKGRIGLGTGKATEVSIAIQKAILQAKKSLFNVAIFKDTIPHDVKVKFNSARIYLMPAGPGTGVIAGGSVKKIAELAGIKNMLSKCFGSTNKLNNAYATIEALQSLRARQAAPAKQAKPTQVAPEAKVEAEPKKEIKKPVESKDNKSK